MASRIGGMAGWLIGKWRGRQGSEPRLALLERIALAPRQSLALVEADGRRILVATSPEGGPAFYPLGRSPACDTSARMTAVRTMRHEARRRSRVSW